MNFNDASMQQKTYYLQGRILPINVHFLKTYYNCSQIITNNILKEQNN